MKIFIKIIRSNFKKSKIKKVILLIIKNSRNENYLNAINLTNKVIINKNFKFIDIFYINIAIKEILVDINLNL